MTLSPNTLFLDMEAVLGFVEYIDPPNVLAAVSVGHRKGVGEIPADAWHTGGSSSGNLPLGTVATIQPNTDTIWMETEMNYSS